MMGYPLFFLLEGVYSNKQINLDIHKSFELGNKGGVAIRLEYHKTSICFVCSHLAAHQNETLRRNQDYNEICKRLIFNQLEKPPKINDHDMVFWMGDLNYR